MQDIQSQKDHRSLHLELVGIKQLAAPFFVVGKNKKLQPVTAFVNFYADLTHNLKGHHLSRFVEILYKNRDKSLSPHSLTIIAKESRKELKSEKIWLEVSFIYFIQKQSPVSKKYSFGSYNCQMIVEGNTEDNKQKMIVNVPVLLLCPCSKAISKYNAHNQRANLRLEVDFSGNLWIEDLVKIAEKEGSSEIYPLLKRVDEKYVTETSYDNPKFVEDIVRDVALKIKKISNIKSFIVDCESFESIHKHNTYAKYSSGEILK